MEAAISRRNSITRRLSLIVGGALVAAVLVVGGMALLEQRRQLTRALETKAASLAQFMAQVSPISILSLNFVEMNNNVKKVVLTDDEAVYAIIVNEKGIPLVYYLKDGDPAVTGEARALWGKRSPLAAIDAMKRSARILEVNAPINAGEKLIGSATVGFSFDHMHRALMVQIALIGAILVVVTGASLLLLELALRRILQPVQALTSAATQISTGDLNIVLTGTDRDDELGVLSRAFDSMATQLRGLIAGMEQRMSELQRMGQALQKSEAEFRRIVSTASEGIWVLGPNALTTFVNARMANMLGYSSEEMMGRSFADFMVEEDLPDHRKKMENRSQGRSEAYERRFLRKDGQTVWTLVSATPVFDDLNRYEGSFGMFTDITERKRVEEALRESEQRYRLVFENSPVSIWEEDFSGVKALFDDLRKMGVSDLETHFAQHPEAVLQCAELAKVVDVNRAALTLHAAASKEELLAGLLNTFTPESFDTFRLELICLWNGGAEMTRDAVVKTLAGTHRHVTVYFSVCPGYEKTLSKILVSLADITDRKLAEAEILRLNQELEQRVAARTSQLEAANKELEAFSYSVSHDLRTPLRAIDGFSHILLEDYAGELDDEGKRLLRVVRENTSRMGQLIDDILKFSRTGRVELTFSGIDMEGMARAVFEELRSSGENKVQLEIGQLPPARGDSAMMRQVFVNLLSNAIKFSRNSETPRVEVGGFMEGDEATYYVKDNGVGFDMQYSDKLFGVFQRLHTVNEFEGTGIGLAIVKRIITRHGGRVWAESKPNEGATFYFSIPVPTLAGQKEGA